MVKVSDTCSRDQRETTVSKITIVLLFLCRSLLVTAIDLTKEGGALIDSEVVQQGQ